ncbi:hypothetical protein F5876DRAFT_91876 [Lentinula aff. lateritia]|uniref:Uncharacterized protein n=1 Tax=Lentinula aff. lateritia TaxID=2804960 RepID=A0ACC1THG4_9AGAR|nr:hypothetical protein F5876DRAFT_91876 [Lentinula aff. lateritia]
MKSSLIYSLPTLANLGASYPTNRKPDPQEIWEIASGWLTKLGSNMPTEEFLENLFIPQFPQTGVNAYWRDILSLTWDIRTFAGISQIKKLLDKRLPLFPNETPLLIHKEYAALQWPLPDLVWIQFFFSFKIHGTGSGIGSNEWKAYTVMTALVELEGYPERIGIYRNITDRAQKHDVKQVPPLPVLIIGGGQSGLEIAARLQCLDVQYLVVEKAERLGGNWRSRYDSLQLHDPICINECSYFWKKHSHYISFPANWPIFIHAKKMANFLESYASILDLNVSLGSEVKYAAFNEDTQIWTVTVEKQKMNETCNLTARHIIFATGVMGGEAEMPIYPGMNSFQGVMLHSLQYKNAANMRGKRVVVVGAGSSGHDICADLYAGGIDVTMFQRSSTCVVSTENGLRVLLDGLYEENGPPTEIADLVNASIPNLVMVQLGRIQTEYICQLDKDILNALHTRGFQTNRGYMDAGPVLSAWHNASGYYLNVGASQLIADGKIKLKSGGNVAKIAEDKVFFDDGSHLEADVIIFATGFGEARVSMRRICGEEAYKKMKPVWGMDDEGEMQGMYKDMGIPGLWCMMGNLALCRFYSKHVALQIKAMETGIFTARYTD